MYGKSAEEDWTFSLGKFIDYDIYVTDKDEAACQRLREHLMNDPQTKLMCGYDPGSAGKCKIKFARPDLREEVAAYYSTPLSCLNIWRVLLERR